MNNKNLKNKTAFSLIELSIVMLIIGLVIAAIAKGSVILSYTGLTNGRTITNFSPVPSIPDLGFWVDTTSEKSFEESELQTSSLKIGTWKDINPNSSIHYDLTQTTDANKPTYVKNCLNSLPCLRFSNNYFNGSGKIIDGKDLTIFFVTKLYSGCVISASSSSSFYIKASGNLFDIQVNGSSTGSTAHNYTAGTPGIFSITVSNRGVKMFANGQNFQSNPSFIQSIPATATITIGYSTYGGNDLYNGDIGEIIIYNRGLANDEKMAIEAYLSKKWGIKLQ